MFAHFRHALLVFCAQTKWTSRDFSLALFFSTMLLIPAGGLVIATASGNPSINALQVDG